MKLMLPRQLIFGHSLVAITLLLTACVAAPPSPPPTEPGPVQQRVVGVVNAVDVRDKLIEITTDRDSSVAPGRRLTLYYDDTTPVEFVGHDYRPMDLEPGDRIVAGVKGDFRHLEVQSILVTHDASSDDILEPAYDRNYDRAIAGTLREIDERERTLTLSVDRNRDAVIGFDSRTRVLYGDRRIAISELREYDELEIELVPGDREGIADTITVVNGGLPSDPDDDLATTRGEVVFVDESRRQLVVTTDADPLASFDPRRSMDPRSSFDTRRDERTTFHFEPDVIVEFEGDYYGPSNLERGDEVQIDYETIGDDLWARRILVRHSAS